MTICNSELLITFFTLPNNKVAISQRHHSKFYPHLQPPSDGSIHPSTIMIQTFFETYIQHRFSSGEVDRYVVDVYIDSQERVWIVDFNVWGDRTDGLLFDWEELTKLGDALMEKTSNGNAANDDDDSSVNIPMPEMRVVTKDMKSMTYDPLSSYRGPTDVVDLLGGNANNAAGGNGNASFENFMKQCIRPSEI